MKKVAIASDHAGVAFKAKLQSLLPDIQWSDLGPTTDASVDYPDFAAKACEQVTQGKVAAAILICGSGIGMSIAANKVHGIRAALCTNPFIARLAREHNDANALCLGARFLAPEYAAEIAKTFFASEFCGEPRHKTRVQKLADLEQKQ